MRIQFVVSSFFAMAVLSAVAHAAPLSYSGGTYTQNFDGLPTNATNASQTVTGRGPHEFSVVTNLTAGSMDGWQFANPTGSGANTEFKSHDGSLSGSAGRGVISFGTNGAADRALGTLATSNQISTIGLVLQNNSANTFTQFTLSYIGEQWRRGTVPAPNTLAFAYGLASGIDGSLTNASSLDFIAPNTQVTTDVALDGNLTGNQTAKSDTITGLNWGPGQTLVLRWSGQDQTGNDDGIGIDTLSFTAAVPEPTSFSLFAIAMTLGAFARRRSRQS
jgi:hypothetical protein